MKKRIFLMTIALVAIAIGIVGMSAYEAHVVNVTATIENATLMSSPELAFGTTFPQEILHRPETISLSKSFIDSEALGVTYKIKQKPKCQNNDPAGDPKFAQVTENADGNFICPEGFSAMPLLCPYLSKTSSNPLDLNVPSFHGTTSLAGWTNAVSEQLKATGELTKQAPSTTWDIDLHVPCISGQCAQDWPAYVHAANAKANPADYMLDPNNEGDLLGCDLWYEVTGVNRTPVTPPTETRIIVKAADLAADPAAVQADPTKWFMYNDSNDTIDNTLGSFVAGPSTPIRGTGSVEFTLAANPLDRKNIATYKFSGIVLSTITQMSFGAYSHNGSGGAGANESPYLHFNVDFNGTDLWQKRLVYVPSANGSVPQDAWNSFDVINGGNALWTWSGYAANGNKWPDNNVNEYRTFPGVRVRVTDSWLGVRVGEPGPTGYTGNVDFFSIATGGIPTVYDFEN
jgi:hypothetical protein